MIVFDVLVASCVYFFFAAAVVNGIPPFYIGSEHTRDNPDYAKQCAFKIFAQIPIIALGILGFIGLTYLYRHSIFLLLPAVSLIIATIRLRRFLREETPMPYPFIDLLLPRRFRRQGLFHRWPMLLFDIWTLGWVGFILLAQAVLPSQ